jgi:uncharacterized protein involved in response to NO
MSASGRDAPAPSRAAGAAVVWPWFVRASLWLAATAGFGLGAALFAASALGLPFGAWWPAAAQAHGHIQVFGWAGLMVLGVGLHFLPRLRGTALAHPEWARHALELLVAGLVSRAVSQPLLAQASATPLLAILRICLVGSGMLEIAGASLILWLLANTLRHGPPLRTRAGLWPVLPFFFTAFAAYWVALIVSQVGLIAAMPSPSALVPDQLDEVVNQIAFYGFLIPISVAMSERNFPLFLRTPRPRLRLLRAGLALLVAGLGLRVIGNLANAVRPAGLGDLAQAAAICTFIVALGIFAPRRPLPRQPVHPFRDPVQLHAIAAYLWLAVVALLLAWDSLAALGFPVTAPPPDAERHALGTGFVTLLILGLGARLLPSFASRRARSNALIWVTLALGNIAALLRVGPLLYPALFLSAASAAMSLAGIAALAALIVFSINVPVTPRR